MHIDLHCHIFPKDYLDLIAREGPRFGVRVFRDKEGSLRCELKGAVVPPLEPFFVTEERLRAMDAMGVDMEAVSLSSRPGLYWADGALGAELSRAANEGYARLMEEHPTRFQGFAAVPAQDIPASIREVEHAVGKLGLRGVYMGSNVRGKYLDHKDFWPLYEAVAAHGVPIIIHPINPMAREALADYHLLNVIGFTAETAADIARLIFSGALDATPDLRLLFLHGGGTFPYLLGRVEHAHKVRPECRKMKKKPGDYLGNFYFDTVVFRPAALSFLVETVGSDHVVLGTDMAYDMADTDPVGTLRAAPGLSEEDQEDIAWRTAAKLLGLKVQAG
ncbi:MAG: amidohydrolase family protein [Nitrospinota bacterium]